MKTPSLWNNNGRSGAGSTSERSWRYTLASDDRAVSELVGFSLTFGIVLVSVALVATVGFGQLTDFRDAQQLDNAEQAIEIVGQSLDSIEERTAVTRIDTIDLSGGAIEIKRGADVDVTVETGGTTHSETVPLNSLVYASGSTNISYESGATFRQQKNGGIINTGPKFVCNDDVAVLSFVSLQSSQTGSIQSDGPVEISAEHNGTDLIYPVDRTGAGSASDVESVELVFDSPRETQWLAHFDNAENWTVSGSTAECGGGGDPLDRMYVRQTNVSMSFAS